MLNNGQKDSEANRQPTKKLLFIFIVKILDHLSRSL
jgi:hypothetical protein